MVRNPLTTAVIAAIGIATSAIVLTAAAASTVLSLAVSDESAPPGAIVQVKVSVTEPKPISTGRGRLSGVGKVAGISLRSRLNDAYGVAVVDEAGLDVSVRSPASSFGTDLDYPVLTVAAQVPASMGIGSTAPVDLELGSLRMLNAAGAVYPTEVKSGSITARPGLWVGDIVPGSADLPAGAVVSIRGGGFRRDVRVRFDEVRLASVTYVSTGEVRVVLAQPARMHGMRVRVENRDGTRTTYYSYQRTTRVTPSTRPVLKAAVPLFPYRFATTAQITAGSGITALAMQNLQPVTVSFAIDVFRPDRSLARTVTGTLLANRFFVREISEILGQAYGPGWIVRVRAARPVQVMGVTIDAAGDASPLLPR